MSKVTEPMLLDKTGQQLLGAMTKQNELLTAIASGYNYKPTSIADVFAVVQSGKANQVFNYGDQIILPWTDKATGKTYECPLDVVHFGDVTLADGETVSRESSILCFRGAEQMKKYRVNESEHFNLYSMHDKLKCIEIDMQEAPAHTYTDEQWNEVQERICEVEELMEKAYCVGALVDWPTLKRIREIKEERQLMRYNACMEQGASEKDAAMAFEL